MGRQLELPKVPRAEKRTQASCWAQRYPASPGQAILVSQRGRSIMSSSWSHPGASCPAAGCGKSWQMFFLAAGVFNACFQLIQSQTYINVGITLKPPAPVAKRNVTLVPGGEVADVDTCFWFRGGKEEKHRIFSYLLSPHFTPKQGPAYTGRETGDKNCSLHIRNLKAEDTGNYVVLKQKLASSEFLQGHVYLLVKDSKNKAIQGETENPHALLRIIVAGTIILEVGLTGLVLYYRVYSNNPGTREQTERRSFQLQAKGTVGSTRLCDALTLSAATMSHIQRTLALALIGRKRRKEKDHPAQPYMGSIPACNHISQPLEEKHHLFGNHEEVFLGLLMAPETHPDPQETSISAGEIKASSVPSFWLCSVLYSEDSVCLERLYEKHLGYFCSSSLSDAPAEIASSLHRLKLEIGLGPGDHLQKQYSMAPIRASTATTATSKPITMPEMAIKDCSEGVEEFSGRKKDIVELMCPCTKTCHHQTEEHTTEQPQSLSGSKEGPSCRLTRPNRLSLQDKEMMALPTSPRGSPKALILAGFLLSCVFSQLVPAQNQIRFSVDVKPPNPSAGQDVTFSLRNIPSPLIECSWTRDSPSGRSDEILAQNTSDPRRQIRGSGHTGRETLGPDCSLHIRELRKTDKGNYTVNILVQGNQNSGKGTSQQQPVEAFQTVYLSVSSWIQIQITSNPPHPKPGHNITLIQERIPQQFDSCVWSKRSLSGTQEEIFDYHQEEEEWKQKGSSARRRVKVLQDCSLHITNAVSADTGNYTVTAEVPVTKGQGQGEDFQQYKGYLVLKIAEQAGGKEPQRPGNSASLSYSARVLLGVLLGSLAWAETLKALLF
ncbi:uncharacterized protein LOC128332883 [Hemicordylus capensis]|uniref:uncharacterized protein LOC128332883 n=1 Tax=Hemicordylus capensis TaxID=884348 RepID=UPI002303E56B|nr:uncharacterized protein LOC128332883 [Hemicordylus capensis]